jgi:uncharacterized protein (DUF1800 family)
MTDPIDPSRRSWLGAMAGAVLAGCATDLPTPGVSAPKPGVFAPPAGTPAMPLGPAARLPAPPAVALPDDDAFARHLLNRFAYGPRPGDVARLRAVGAAGWLDAQLRPESIVQPEPVAHALAALPTLSENHTATLAAFARLQADALRAGRSEAERAEAARGVGALVRRVQDEARQARLLRAVAGERQLEEVLVEFWFNHFNVFAGKESVRATVGFYETEAIRPHVLGRFRDLLGATARHPAMLNYLDNWQSVVAGFRPPAGAVLPEGFRAPRGPNENYARELLELHTLGVDGGYLQADVAALARVFTGWSFDRREPGPDHAFRFYRARHDAGPKRLLGLEVPGGDVQAGEWALDLLARHPSTARHVSHRLARAFVADQPPPGLVERLAARFLETDGDLRDLVRTLATSPEFVRPEAHGGKFKTPYHYVVSASRAIGDTAVAWRPLAGAVARMGMPIYGCPTPDGWRDTRDAWLNADGLRQRVEFAGALARTAAAGPRADATGPVAPRTAAAADAFDAAAALPEPVAAVLARGAREALAAVPARERLTVALASPDFMRR